MVTVLIYTSAGNPLTLDEALEIVGHDDIRVTETDEGHISGFEVQWEDGLSAQLTSLSDDDAAPRLAQLVDMADALLGKREDKKAKKVIRRAENVSQVFTYTVTPDWDIKKRAQHFLQWVMESFDYAFLVTEDGIYNENGTREVGTADSPSKYFYNPETDAPASEVIVGRKKRTLDRLKAERIPYIEHLAIYADESTAQLRPLETVVRRAVALKLIAEFANTLDVEAFHDGIEAYGIEDDITTDEWVFVNNEEREEIDVIKFSQRYESCWILLWAIGQLEYTGKPDTFAHEEKLKKIIERRTLEELIATSELRPLTEILDEVDLIYRYHWAVIDAELYGRRVPPGLDSTVVYERHYALNWLIGYQDQPWDEITTDT